MNLDLTNKSPRVATLLVNLYDNHKLYGMVDNADKEEVKKEVSQAVTELFTADLPASDQEVISDVLIGLMRQVEMDMRMDIAEKLSGFEHVPLRLILHLANDQIEIASPILKNSPILSDLDLIYIIKSQGNDYWQAIAERETLSSQIIDTLADTRDVSTAIVLSKNERVTLTRHAMEILSEVAADNRSVSEPLLKRAELPADLAEFVHKHVAEQVSSYVDIAFDDETTPELDLVMEDVVHKHAPRRPDSEFMPRVNLIDDAKIDRRRGLLNMDKMIMSLQNGHIDRFVAEFSVFSGLSVRRIHDFILQACPKGLAIACKAYGMSHDEFSRVYLLTHKARSEYGVVNPAEIVFILEYFDGVNRKLARRIADRSKDSI